MRISLAITAAMSLVACVEEGPSTATTGGGGGKADGFDAWRDQVYCEPDTGVCIVEGDIPVAEDKLQIYFETTRPAPGGLTVYRQNDRDLLWNAVDRFDLTYCVDAVGLAPAEYEGMVAAMATATAEWEAVAKVDFRHVRAEDSTCADGNPRVRFPITPAPWGASYIARAFFPYSADYEPAIRMDFSQLDALRRTAPEATLEGILRHELGHVLGFRHEHIRPENSSFCRETPTFRPITEYDRRSTMHYPWCDGEGDWSLQLTELDRIGASFFYPDFTRYRGDRCPGSELRPDGSVDAACAPVVHEILELANTAPAATLRNLVQLDSRAVEAIVTTRTTRPFTQLAALDAITYVGPVALRRMYDYLYVNGRCATETDLDGLINTNCRPVVHRLLQLANTAGTDVLDWDVRLDRRAAQNIVAHRIAHGKFTSLVELWAIPYVKTTALAKMYDYLY